MRRRSPIVIGSFVLAFLSMMPTRSAFASVDPVAASAVFAEARAICDRDAGLLWGRSLCGPMLLVDPVDRTVVADFPDAEGRLAATGAVFTGTLPEDAILANTTITWSGTHWTEILWPMADDPDHRHVLIAHELFHRLQDDLGMPKSDGGNVHLDTMRGRYLLQLEWRALAQALSKTGAGRRTAIADALLFRAERHRLFSNASHDEGALEANEGVAEYTGVRAGLATPSARTAYAIHDLSAFVDVPTFVRSFAYATGPAYGLLLDRADPRWRETVALGLRFDQRLASALRLPAPAFASLYARERVYDDGALLARESRRDEEQRAQTTALTAKLVDGPVLALPLAHASFQFNPQTLRPLGKIGIVYPTIHLSDDWGSLDVDGDALLDETMTLATVSAAAIDPAGAKGDGWHLALKTGWVLAPGPRPGDYVVAKVSGR